MKKMIELRNVFLVNRAEQLPLDVWESFVIPPHFSTLNKLDDKKSVFIEGGRGSGKTMFIRYFCHPTIFSPKRSRINISAIKSIGIYWKPDTRFCGLLGKGWLKESDADNAFLHYFTLNVLYDFCNSLESVDNYGFEEIDFRLLKLEIPESLRLCFNDEVILYDDIIGYVKKERQKLIMWAQNQELEKPVFLTFDDILEQLISELINHTNLPHLFYQIFIDEFENLTSKQQILINDFIKRPSSKYSVNVALRTDAKISHETSGFEQIMKVHDYRSINLERDYSRNPELFKLFSAEVLLYQLSQWEFDINTTLFKTERLRDISSLALRNSKEYKDEVLTNAKRIFPQLSVREISKQLIRNTTFYRKSTQIIEKGLKRRKVSEKYNYSNFFDESLPEASLVNVCLVNRDNLDLSMILDEFKKHKSGGSVTKYDSSDGWIHNNLHGVIFLLYQSYLSKPCLLYSGFDRFCSLAKSNLRIFQELCHNALLQLEEDSFKIGTSINELMVPPESQAKAAKIVSEELLNDISKHGKKGPELKGLIKRLGKIFQLAHKRESQSEVEISHFSLPINDLDELSEDIFELIGEGKIWSVLYTYQDTKNKSKHSLSDTDIVPHPIFSPYYGISYRKKKKLELTVDQFNQLISPTPSDFQLLVSYFQKKWGNESDSPEQQELL